MIWALPEALPGDYCPAPRLCASLGYTCGIQLQLPPTGYPPVKPRACAQASARDWQELHARMAQIMSRMHRPDNSQDGLRIALACLRWAVVDRDGAAHLSRTVHEQGELKGIVPTMNLDWIWTVSLPRQCYRRPWEHTRKDSRRLGSEVWAGLGEYSPAPSRSQLLKLRRRARGSSRPILLVLR